MSSDKNKRIIAAGVGASLLLAAFSRAKVKKKKEDLLAVETKEKIKEEQESNRFTKKIYAVGGTTILSYSITGSILLAMAVGVYNNFIGIYRSGQRSIGGFLEQDSEGNFQLATERDPITGDVAFSQNRGVIGNVLSPDANIRLDVVGQNVESSSFSDMISLPSAPTIVNLPRFIDQLGSVRLPSLPRFLSGRVAKTKKPDLKYFDPGVISESFSDFFKKKAVELAKTQKTIEAAGGERSLSVDTSSEGSSRGDRISDPESSGRGDERPIKIPQSTLDRERFGTNVFEDVSSESEINIDVGETKFVDTSINLQTKREREADDPRRTGGKLFDKSPSGRIPPSRPPPKRTKKTIVETDEGPSQRRKPVAKPVAKTAFRVGRPRKTSKTADFFEKKDTKGKIPRGSHRKLLEKENPSIIDGRLYDKSINSNVIIPDDALERPLF